MGYVATLVSAGDHTTTGGMDEMHKNKGNVADMDEMHKDEMHKDMSDKDEMHKDAMRKDKMHKDMSDKDEMHKDAMRKDMGDTRNMIFDAQSTNFDEEVGKIADFLRLKPGMAYCEMGGGDGQFMTALSKNV